MKQTLRYAILAIFLIGFSIFSARHFTEDAENAPSVDAMCPFGGFESAVTLIKTGNMVPRVMASSFVLAGGVILVSLVFARGFCGWICPFGTVQELLGMIYKNKPRLPIFEKKARLLKYIILLAIIVFTPILGYLVFRGYDPFMTFFHFGRGVFWNYEEGHITAFTITIIVLFMSVFISRFWCRYFCPLGAVTAILRKFNITGIKRSSKCIDCKICDRECPVGIHVSRAKEVYDEECLNCNKCIDHCPVDALEAHTMKKKISSAAYGLMVVGLFLIVIGASMALGIWQSVPVLVEGEPLNPDDIKGSMAVDFVLDGTGLTKEQFAREFALPQDIDTSIKLNEIAGKYNVDFHTEYLREYLRLKDNPQPKSTCPFGLIADSYPGRCGLYVDSDNNRICDYSE